MSDPSPLSSPDLDMHWLLVGPCPKICVWHFVEPFQVEYLTETLVDEGLGLLGADAGDSSCFRAIH